MRNLIYISLIALFFSCSTTTEQERTSDFNKEWKFTLVSDFDKVPENDAWQSVNLPHDWSIEMSYDSVNGEGATAYLPGGKGIYRKQFELILADNEMAYLYFDGVYNNSETSVNDKKLGEHPYGYSPFYYDITSALNSNGKQVVEVEVDHSAYADSRWYTGSGIYRNVQLIKVDKLHIPIWGTFITTPEVNSKLTVVNVQTTVRNDYAKAIDGELITRFFDKNNVEVASKAERFSIESNLTKFIVQNISIENPALWGVFSPDLYKAVSEVMLAGQLVDSYETTFGVRSILFDADKGFFLNGENMKIKGVCLHHDAGLVGSAVPKGVWRQRLRVLKDGGCNAIRISHNPASEEFLELCDELGFLVQDEFFDEWDFPKDKRLNCWLRKEDDITAGYTHHFQEWAEKDLKSVILAHRNHPSVFQWSIGNEIEWTYPGNRKATGFFDNMDWNGNYFWSQPPYSLEKIKKEYAKLPETELTIGGTAQKLANWTREMDTTRPVIANCILPSVSFESGYADALDIVGFSYRRVMYDYAKENYPDKVVMGTESLGQYHEWKAIMERDFISGTFLWTGIDYMGEANDRWPSKGLRCGLMDITGQPKAPYYMMKSLWADEDFVYIASQNADQSKYKVADNGKVVEKTPGYWETALWEWHVVNEHWNYKENEEVIIEVISNCPEVELFLNDKSLGKKQLSAFEDHIYKWAVPFKGGELKAIGNSAGNQVEQVVNTAGEATQIILDLNKSFLTADGYDVVHVMAQLADDEGNPVKTQNATITFEIDGEVTSLGVDNASMANTQDHNSNKIKTFEGRALIILQATQEKGQASIKANAGQLGSQLITIPVE